MSIPNDVPITPEGLRAVEHELHELTSKNRPAIVAKIKAARELEAIVKNHVLIQTTAAKGVVGMGSTVRFVEDGEDGEESYRIVGSAEANPKEGRVSFESAVGKALLGRRVGDEVQIKTPGGAYSVRITAIE
jgi:transcription elongation factor GreA